MRTGRLALIAFGASWLGACGFLPPSQQQEFAVSAASSVPSVGVFANADPGIDAVQARQACVEGYEKQGEQTLPADPGTLNVWRVRCTPHAAWYWPEF